MFSIIIASLLFVVAIIALFAMPPTLPRKGIAFGLMIFSFLLGGSGAVSYNDAGYCTHIRTIFGTETSKCDVGWYASGWGTATQWPLYITVQNTIPGAKIEVTDSLALFPSYSVRLADNWSGDITQTTRFGIPQNEEQFLKLAHDYRTPQNLISTILVPTVSAAIDTTANLYTMEEYYAGGARDSFKKEYTDTVVLGPAVTERIVDPQQIHNKVSANVNSDVTKDENEVAGTTEIKIVEKKTDRTGSDIRPSKNQYSAYGIVVNSAIIQNLDPDDRYEEQIQKRKEAISRRVIARDQRLEQDEQRFLTIAKSETEIANRQGAARVVQIEQTTNAETSKKLALIKAQQMTEQAEIEKKTAAINFETAKIEADSKIVSAEADAKARQLAIEADNALQSKIDAEVKIQTVWAQAYSTRNVPQIVMGGSSGGAPVGSDSEVSTLLNLLNADAAKRLSYDRTIESTK